MMKLLIELLLDLKIHTHKKIAQSLGVGYDKLHQAVIDLKTAGIEIEVLEQGYRLVKKIEPLDCQRISQALDDSLQKTMALYVVDITESTNDEVLNYFKNNQRKLPIYLAEYQTKGRGRLGRSWYSPYASNLILSYGWRNPRNGRSLDGLSLVIGMAVVSALEKLGCQNLQLKWPNDLVFASKKLGGILIDVLRESDGSCKLAIGIGLNLYLPENNPVDQPCISLNDILAKPLSRNQVAIKLINEVAFYLRKFTEKGFAGLASQWQKYDFLLTKIIRVEMGSIKRYGVGLGVSACGGYRVKMDQGEFLCQGGEISLKTNASA